MLHHFEKENHHAYAIHNNLILLLKPSVDFQSILYQNPLCLEILEISHFFID